MIAQAITPRRLFGAVFAAVLLVALGLPLASSNAKPSEFISLSATSKPGDSRVYITLTSNNLTQDINKRQARRLAREQRSAARAREIAQVNPYIVTEQEKRAARSIERSRNQGLAALRAAAEPDAAANEQIARLIKRGGGEIHFSTPLPNSITATVSPRLLSLLERNPLVESVQPAGPAPHLMNSPVDGSETWHTNGFTGNGSSADGNGGPDFAVVDAGIRTSHLAFRTRLPGDPNNGPATGPTRITSPPGRAFFGGSEHGNTVAATVANTDLTQPVWPYNKGLAYGIDKVYDPYQAQSGFFWIEGVTYNGEPGVSDLPEAVNYSSGLYEDTTDFNPTWIFMDNQVATFGMTYSISAGNCGVEGGGFTGCSVIGQGPHRVSTPGNNHNSITVGGLDYNGDIYNSSVWIPWANSSPGPTWGGRKKPDLIHKVTASAGGPSQQNDLDYVNPDSGTSFAAPNASAGALLLASVGVYQPTAQKAILINTATPIQSQTYWTPKSGWGALDLDAAFHQRGNYASSSITPQSENGVRFFRATGVTSGDRSTLVWNRRLATGTTYRPLTNLDLSQHNQATGATTATGGSDAADSVDTDQTISANNPMPGSGTDGGDNVEQVRSTSSGTQVLKVKNMGTIDGLPAEPFSIASKNPLTPLATPVPEVTLTASPTPAGTGQNVTVTADVTNSSPDIALTGTQVTLTPPSGVSITGGTPTQVIGALAAGDNDTVVWQVQGTTEGLKSLSADSEGSAYGETFTATDTDDLTVDSSPPTASVTGPGEWSPSSNATFNWGANDASGIASYDVSTSIGGAAPTLVMDDTSDTSASFSAPEGVGITVYVTAKDNAGNESAAASASTTIDAVPPTITLGAPVISRGSATASVSGSNLGSPVSIAAAFAPSPITPLLPLAGSTVSYRNPTAKAISATLRASATDALGRVASAATVVLVPSKWTLASPKISKPKSRTGVTTIAGTISRSARGKVRISVKRFGANRTKRVSRTAAIKRGKFSTRMKLAAGRYRVTVTYPGSLNVLKASTTRRFSVR